MNHHHACMALLVMACPWVFAPLRLSSSCEDLCMSRCQGACGVLS